MDGVELEILWSNLIGIVTERAKALQRIAFSPVVREAGDLACALFDRRGRMVAQAVTAMTRAPRAMAYSTEPSLEPLSAIKTSPATPERARNPWALSMQVAMVSASLRQGMRIVSSTSRLSRSGMAGLTA